PPRRVRQPPETPSTCSSYSHGHLFREVAGGPMVARLLFQGRLDLGTRRRHLGDGASRMKPAARWRIDRRGDLSAQMDDPSFGLNVRVRDGNRRKERLGVGMARIAADDFQQFLHPFVLGSAAQQTKVFEWFRDDVAYRHSWIQR